MKYLIRFNESESTKFTTELQETIREILLPISDMGYNINIRTRNLAVSYEIYQQGGKRFENVLTVGVVKNTDRSLEITDDIKDEFIRMGDYIHSKGLSIEVACIHLPIYEIINGTSVTIRVISFDDFLELCRPLIDGELVNLTVRSLTFNIRLK